MSMHLSKIRVIEKSDKRKWSSSEAKQKASELDKAWKKLNEKHSKPLGLSSSKKPTLAQKRIKDSGCGHLTAGFIPPRGKGPVIPSKGDSVGVAAKPEIKQYTGDAVLGISIVHKSCLQPVFSEEQAKDFASMRR